jgi:hypothetical protein
MSFTSINPSSGNRLVGRKVGIRRAFHPTEIEKEPYADQLERHPRHKHHKSGPGTSEGTTGVTPGAATADEVRIGPTADASEKAPTVASAPRRRIR